MTDYDRSAEGFAWTPGETIHGLPTASVVESNADLPPAYEVVVIGAGFAGLIAARDISRYAKVLLLDARDRIGGRAWTAHAFGQELEMGAANMHWAQPHIYTELHRYNLHHNLTTVSGTTSATRDFYHLYQETCRKWDPRPFRAKFDNCYAKIFTVDGLTVREYIPWPLGPPSSNELYAKYDQLSLSDRLKQVEFDDEHEELLASSFECFGFSTPGDVGFMEVAKWLALAGGASLALAEITAGYRIGNGGTTALARAIFDDIEGDFICHAAVERISVYDGGVDICLQDGRHVSAASEAIANANSNRATKFHFEFDKRQPAFEAVSEKGAPFVWSCSVHDDPQSNKTYSMAYGNDGHFPDVSDADSVIPAYKEMFPFDVPLSGYAIHDWNADPFSRTSWGFFGPGYASKYLAELQAPHAERVFMASSDWADGWRNWLDGAVEQGTRNARQVIDALREAYQASLETYVPIKEEPSEYEQAVRSPQ